MRGTAADPLSLAMQAVTRAPGDETSWDALERLGRESGRAEDVAATYRAVLARPSPPELALRIGARAIAFHDEWAPDDGAVRILLERMSDVDPNSEVVLARLSLLHANAERWEELLALYDRAIAAAPSSERRGALLAEAARVAKDCAGQSERAISYMTALFALRPGDAKGAATLERLLKQQRRWRELVDLWSAQLDRMTPREAAEQRARIGATWLAQLHDAGAALAAIEPLLEADDTLALALPVLSGVVAAQSADRAHRQRAFAVLETRCDGPAFAELRIAALRAMLAAAEDGERVGLHRDLAARLLASSDAAFALEHVGALVVLDPAAWSDAALTSLVGGLPVGVGRETLTVDAAVGRQLVHESAARAARDPALAGRAIELYRVLVATGPRDLVAIESLAKLYERVAATPELLALRKSQIALTTDLDARLALRLGVARLLAETGADDELAATLRESLAEAPGHAATIDALGRALRDAGQDAELADMLETEGDATDRLGRGSDAARLWAAAAEVAERALSSRERAASLYERAAAREPLPFVLDSLARLEASRGDYARVSSWLERRLETAEPSERADVALRLAEARVAEGDLVRARAVLSAAHEKEPAREDLLTQLAGLLRDARAYDELAAALLRGADHAAGDSARVRLRVQAASVLAEELADPWRAADTLKPALALAPDDAVLCAALAHALRRSGRLLEARDLLVSIVERYGKRRPRERAEAHYQLACVRDALARPHEALEELEHAVAIDPEHLRAQKLLGDLAFASAHLERADRAYTAVMVVLARSAARPAGAPAMVAALFDLYRVATKRGLPRAAENLASAFEIAGESSDEARALEALFEEAGEHELLLRALELRLAHAATPAERGEAHRQIAAAHERTGDVARAFASFLAALEDAPDDEVAHARAAALAIAAGREGEHRARVEAMAEAARRDGAGGRLSLLLLVLASLREAGGAYDEAAVLLARAEETGERLPEIWRATARVAHVRGDGASELAALRRMDSDDLDAKERAPLLLALASLELEIDPTMALGTLDRALEIGLEPRAARPLLERACADPALAGRAAESLVALARSDGDSDLLAALVLVAGLPEPPTELVREAAVLAGGRGDAREGALLLRAAELGDGEIATWALRELAAKARARGDAPSELRHLRDARALAPAHETRELDRAIAALLAAPLGDLPAACDAYQALYDDDPSDGAVAAELLAVARKLLDRDRLDRVLAALADGAYDARERNTLRMERAELLREKGRADEATELLASVLFDEPDHPGAATLLATMLSALGRKDELAELLTRQIELARDRGDGAAVAQLSLRLAASLKQERPLEAAAVLRDAIATAGKTRRLLRALLDVLPADETDRADRMEDLLAAEEEAASPIADRLALLIAIADTRSTRGDAEGAERALLGARTLDPESDAVAERLVSLAEDLVRATRGEGRESLVVDGHPAALLRAGRIFRALGDLSRVVGTLREAHALDPSDPEAGVSLARALFELGDHDAAFSVLDEVPDRPKTRGSALRFRAEILSREQRHDEAVAALEEALASGDPLAEEPLVASLRAAREYALREGAIGPARARTGRLAALLAARGAHAEAIELLEDVLSRVAGDALSEVALEIDALSRGLGRPEAARLSLEIALEARPANAAVRARLRDLYETAGAHRERAALLVLDARHGLDDQERFAALREVGRLRLDVLGEPTGAIGPLSDARAIRPGDQEVTLMLATALVSASMHDDAAQLLRDAIKEHGGKRSRALAALQRRMAEILAAQGDRASELAWLLAAFESHPQSGDVAKALADVALGRGEDEIAARALRAITLLREGAPMPRADAYAKLGEIAARQGDPRKAVTLARKALSEDPANAIAKRLVSSLESSPS